VEKVERAESPPQPVPTQPLVQQVSVQKMESAESPSQPAPAQPSAQQAPAQKSESAEPPPSAPAQPAGQQASVEKPESAEKQTQPAPAQKLEGPEKPAQPAQPAVQPAPAQKPEGPEKPAQPVQPPAQQPPKGPPPMPVEVSKAISRPIRSNTPLTGTVLPVTSVSMSTLIAGQLEEVKIEEGDVVNRGDLLARLRDVEAKIDVQEAEAALEKARRELQKQKSGSRGQEIKSRQAEAAEKKAVMQRLKRELERAENLFSKGIINQSQRDSAEADYKAALSQYESAVANLDLTVEGSRAEDIAMAQAEVTMREAILARKQQVLKDTRITAPISGAIVKKYVEVGEWLSAGGKIADIMDFSTVKISVDVPEREIQSVKIGINAEISVDAYPGQVFTGTVTQIVPAASVNNRTFPVLIQIVNTDLKLKPGMFARVNLILSEDSHTVLVPKDALLTDKDGKKYLFVARNNTAHRVDVETGVTDGNYIEVKGDVKIGELVIVTGNEVLRDKAPVNIAKQF